jgi:predicted nucleic acid-binding protein
VTESVLDASVVLKWFRQHGERHHEHARALRDAFAAGELIVLAPPLLRLELVNVAGRWQWEEGALVELASSLEALGFEFADAELARVASWTARGLTAYDAAYVALAEQRQTRLVTDDDLVVELAPGIAEPLAATRS